MENEEKRQATRDKQQATRIKKNNKSNAKPIENHLKIIQYSFFVSVLLLVILSLVALLVVYIGKTSGKM